MPTRALTNRSGQTQIAAAELVSAQQLDWDKSSKVIPANRELHVEGVLPGTPCQSCGAPREGSSAFCSACGSPLPSQDTEPILQGDSGSNRTAVPDHVLQCKSCGAEVATSIDQRSYVCPFCDTAMVVEIPLAAGRQRPEFVIGFAVSAEQAKEKFWKWLKDNSWFRPGDLVEQAIADKQRGVYLPFWHFSMLAESTWTANIGQYWFRTETYTTTDPDGKKRTHTRQVRETEWFPLQGEHQRYYYGYMVPASRGVSLEESRAIQPYQMSSLARFRPHFLAGWMAEEYSIDRETACQLAIEEFRRRQEQEIAYFLPGDVQSQLQVTSQMQVNGSDLILLPVHVLSYRYKEKVFRFLVNGQTGKIVGEKPISGKRITGLIMLVLLLIALLVSAVVLLTR
jgi:hypothetical protein